MNHNFVISGLWITGCLPAQVVTKISHQGDLVPDL